VADAGAAFLQDLHDRIGKRINTSPDALYTYANDLSRLKPEGVPLAVVLATSTEDVQQALEVANRHRIPVSVRGAGSGLSGGAVGYTGGLVISLDRMNRIVSLNPADRLAVVEPGVITADLDAAARQHGLFFPPDPASSRISTVGGNIATNAGGLRCIAHGVTADSVASLEVVLADGRVMQVGAKTRKNTVGLDMKSLFIGSEGTLGIITRATVRLKPIPPGIPHTFRASFHSLEDAGSAVNAIVQGATTPEVLELLDRLCIDAILDFMPDAPPLPGEAVLIGQTVGHTAREDAEALASLCRDHGAVDTAITLGDDLLEARRLMNPALSAQGLRVSCDVGVPVSRLTEVFLGIQEISSRSGQRIAVAAHAGDGNLHPTVLVNDAPDWYPIAEGLIDEITELALTLGGTITGEHGVGAIKHHQLHLQQGPVELEVQRAIKHTLDPNGILSPGRAI